MNRTLHRSYQPIRVQHEVYIRPKLRFAAAMDLLIQKLKKRGCDEFELEPDSSRLKFTGRMDDLTAAYQIIDGWYAVYRAVPNCWG